MRFVHSADWHLGRLFHGVHLTDDQHYILAQFVNLVKETRAEAVIIAGDVYDRAVPPPEAVEVLDEVLTRLAMDIKVPVIIIAGNHDSPQRTGFGSRLLRPQGVHMFGVPSRQIGCVTLSDDAGPVKIYALPYAEPAIIRECYEDDSVIHHDDAMKCSVRAIRSAHPKGQRSILVGHAFVAGGSESESERPLCVGGVSTVDASTVEGFDYVALGHLHCAQSLGDDRAHYSGSLLKYSFAEAHHQKTIGVIDMDAKGRCHVERHALTARRDVRRIQGTLAEILKGPRKGESRDDYIHVTLEDKGAILDPMGKIREVYPNALALERPFLSTRIDQAEKRIDHTGMGDVELFGQFFEQVTGESISNEQSAAFASVVDALSQRERESVA